MITELPVLFVKDIAEGVKALDRKISQKVKDTNKEIIKTAKNIGNGINSTFKILFSPVDVSKIK